MKGCMVFRLTSFFIQLDFQDLPDAGADYNIDERLKILDTAKFNPFQVPKQLIKRNQPLKE